MRHAKFWYIDGTWYKPPGMIQILLIMFKDIITNSKIPGFYFVINYRTQWIFTKLLTSTKNIITQNHLYEVNIAFIITDCEESLIKAINTVFYEVKIILCYFHFKYITFI